MTDNRKVVNLLDVLKGRVAVGEPIYVKGNPDDKALDAVTQVAQQAALEVGKPARVVRVVELPELMGPNRSK